MSEKADILGVGHKIATGEAVLDEITWFINSLMPEAVNQVNLLFAPRQLAKRDRTALPEKSKLVLDIEYDSEYAANILY